MEVLRPMNIDGSSSTLKGKIRITTRCLWLDKGKLLDALYKAAHAALSSCPVNCPLAHMERIVSEVLRKMVRRYCSKRPEVIVVAVENTVGVLSEERKLKLSRKSRGDLGFPSFIQQSEIKLRKSLTSKSDEVTEATSIMGKIEEEQSEGESSLPLSIHASASIASLDQEVSYSVASTNSEDITESLEGPPAVPLSKAEDVSISEENLNLSQNEKKSGEESFRTPEPKTVSCKPAKRNTWKPEEIKRLIEKRAELDERFQAVKGRMVLWEEVSVSLRDHGIDRTPAQCKSYWASLVQKYEESRNDEIKKKSWPYFAAVDKIITVREAK